MEATIVQDKTKHYPVLLKEIISIITPQYGGTFIDCTFGQGGYTREILKNKNNKVIADLKNIKTLADTCTGGYMKMGIYRHRTIGYWNSDWESLQDQTVYLDSIILRKPKKEEKFKNN